VGIFDLKRKFKRDDYYMKKFASKFLLKNLLIARIKNMKEIKSLI